MADKIVFAENEAPYTDPGAAGQTDLEGPVSIASVDKKAAGTPPRSGTHAGTNSGDGERYASIAPKQEERAKLEREARHTETAAVTGGEK